MMQYAPAYRPIENESANRALLYFFLGFLFHFLWIAALCRAVQGVRECQLSQGWQTGEGKALFVLTILGTLVACATTCIVAGAYYGIGAAIWSSTGH